MVKLIVLLLGTISFGPGETIGPEETIGPKETIGPNTELLFVGPFCAACEKAKIIIEKLRKQGFDIEIIEKGRLDITKIPTLIIRTGNQEIDRLVGLQSERIYRSVISSKETIDLGFTGAINITNGTEPRTLVYRGIIRRASKSPYGYIEIDPDDHPDLIEKYEITKLPTLLLLKEGKEIGRYTGITPYNGSEKK